MMVRHTQRLRRRRTGFTILELLVAISIIATLVALILPAVQSSRAAAKRTACMNNLKNIGLAMHSFANVHGNRLPPLHGLRQETVEGTPGDDDWVPWPVLILDYLDQAALAREWRTPPGNQTYLSVYACPSDSENAQVPGGLSYVVNCGYGLMAKHRFICPGPFVNCGSCPESDSAYNKTIGYGGEGHFHTIVLGDQRRMACRYDFTRAIGEFRHRHLGLDWNFSAAIEPEEDLISRATGVFWNPLPSRSVGNSLAWISNGDGMGQTLMLAERQQARRWGTASVWKRVGKAKKQVPAPDAASSPLRFLGLAGDKGFGIGTEAFRNERDLNVFPATDVIHTPLPQGPLAFHHLKFYFDDTPMRTVFSEDQDFAISPTSAHEGGVNAVFCDGRGTFLSSSLDARIYALLITPDGTRYGQQGPNDWEF